MSLLDTHIGFVEALRSAGLSVSLAEGLDAISALDKVSWHDRETVRAAYAATLVKRFNLRPEQNARSLSLGESIKAVLLLVLARRPRLLILDEPTTGLDPVARHEVISEFMDVLQDESRSILFSSHNTVDVERISDSITFIDRGRIVDCADKEEFLDRWRRKRRPPSAP